MSDLEMMVYFFRFQPMKGNSAAAFLVKTKDKTNEKEELFLIRNHLGEVQGNNGRSQKKSVCFWESFPKCVNQPTHPGHPPQGFVRFGTTKGEIRVKKAIFGLSWGGLDLVWDLP